MHVTDSLEKIVRLIETGPKVEKGIIEKEGIM